MLTWNPSSLVSLQTVLVQAPLASTALPNTLTSDHTAESSEEMTQTNYLCRYKIVEPKVARLGIDLTEEMVQTANDYCVTLRCAHKQKALEEGVPNGFRFDSFIWAKRDKSGYQYLLRVVPDYKSKAREISSASMANESGLDEVQRRIVGKALKDWPKSFGSPIPASSHGTGSTRPTSSKTGPTEDGSSIAASEASGVSNATGGTGTADTKRGGEGGHSDSEPEW